MRLPNTGCQYRFTPADWRFIIETLSPDKRGHDSLALLVEDPDSVRHIQEEVK